MGDGYVDPKSTFPFNVLDELGNQTGQVVEVEKLETRPDGTVIVQDEDGNVYLSAQDIQKLGGYLIAEGDEAEHEYDEETGADYAEEVVSEVADVSEVALEEPGEDFVDPTDEEVLKAVEEYDDAKADKPEKPKYSKS